MSFKERASKCIAQGALTNSKHPDRFSELVPGHIVNSLAEYMYEADGTKWLDMCCGLGSSHFGYGNKHIINAQTMNLSKGGSHSLPTAWEVLASERLKEIFTFVEKVKWVNDGSSACTAACEIARTYTGKPKILTEGYHGWHPEQIKTVAWKPNANNFCISKLEDNPYFDSNDIAAVIVEPVQLDASPERIKFLLNLRERCDKHGALLIFDEVITGLRYPKLGVCNDTGIIPDLLLLGKALGNGEKVGCVAGSAEIMDSEYFVSGTYHGHLLSLVTAYTCMNLALNNHYYYYPSYDLDSLNKESLRFISELNKMSGDMFRLEGWGCRSAFKGDYDLYHQEMAKEHVLFGPSLFFNFVNIRHVDMLLEKSKIIIDRIKNGIIQYIGKKPTPAIASKVRK